MPQTLWFQLHNVRICCFSLLNITANWISVSTFSDILLLIFWPKVVIIIIRCNVTGPWCWSVLKTVIVGDILHQRVNKKTTWICTEQTALEDKRCGCRWKKPSTQWIGSLLWGLSDGRRSCVVCGTVVWKKNPEIKSHKQTRVVLSCRCCSLHLPADSPVLIQSGFAMLAIAKISAARNRHPEMIVSLSISPADEAVYDVGGNKCGGRCPSVTPRVLRDTGWAVISLTSPPSTGPRCCGSAVHFAATLAP